MYGFRALAGLTLLIYYDAVYSFNPIPNIHLKGRNVVQTLDSRSFFAPKGVSQPKINFFALTSTEYGDNFHLEELSHGLTNPTSITAALLLSGAVTFGLFKTIVYWRMQFITAALLTRRLPKIAGGADVLQYSTKNLKGMYYFPLGAVKRLVLSTPSDINQNLADATAAQVGIPTVSVRKQLNGKIECPSGIMDVVVCLGGLSGEENVSKELKEIARILKLGGQFFIVQKSDNVPFLFVQNGVQTE